MLSIKTEIVSIIFRPDRINDICWVQKCLLNSFLFILTGLQQVHYFHQAESRLFQSVKSLRNSKQASKVCDTDKAGRVERSKCDSSNLAKYERMGFWAFGLLVFWSFGLLVFWSFGLFVFLSFCLLVFWAFGLSSQSKCPMEVYGTFAIS